MPKHLSLPELISLKGQKVLVTGAASGIGHAIALRLAEAGASLDLVDINFEGLQALKAELEPFDSRVTLYKVDLSQKSRIDRLWLSLTGEEPDILVNNAGIYPSRTPWKWMRLFCKRLWI